MSEPTTAADAPDEEFAGMVIVDGVRYRPEDVPEGASTDGEAATKARSAANKGRQASGK